MHRLSILAACVVAATCVAAPVRATEPEVCGVLDAILDFERLMHLDASANIAVLGKLAEDVSRGVPGARLVQDYASARDEAVAAALAGDGRRLSAAVTAIDPGLLARIHAIRFSSDCGWHPSQGPNEAELGYDPRTGPEQVQRQAVVAHLPAPVRRAGMLAGPLLAILCLTLGARWVARGEVRRGPRHLCRIPASLSRQSGAMSCALFDVSRRGALLSVPPGHGIEKGERFLVNWSGDWLGVRARWSNDLYVGVAFQRTLTAAYLTQTLALNVSLDGPRGQRRGRAADRREGEEGQDHTDPAPQKAQQC